MGSENYEYRGFLASAWDLLRGDTSDWPDRPIYREIILQYGQPVLDIGCGTGRLLLDYLAAGRRISTYKVYLHLACAWLCPFVKYLAKWKTYLARSYEIRVGVWKNSKCVV